MRSAFRVFLLGRPKYSILLKMYVKKSKQPGKPEFEKICKYWKSAHYVSKNFPLVHTGLANDKFCPVESDCEFVGSEAVLRKVK